MAILFTCSHCRVNAVPNAVSPFTVCPECASSLPESEQRIYRNLVDSNAMLARCERLTGVK